MILKIMRLRTLIFREFGLVSARCLPEMIPAAYIPKPVDKEQFKGLTLPKVICTSICTTTEKGDIFLQSKNTNFINEIKNRIDSFETSGIIDLQTGFYLATANTDSVLRDVLNFVHSETEEIFISKKNSLELIRIETLNDIWWENIRWETIWEEKIRPLD
ncbi:MAG: hypothetical protein KAR21_09090 [Spirochaetales bacterium]|nr:hypothetical protein [Spirochaetales bacterium]